MNFTETRVNVFPDISDHLIRQINARRVRNVFVSAECDCQCGMCLSVRNVFVSAECFCQCGMFLSVRNVFVSAECVCQCGMCLPVRNVFVSAECVCQCGMCLSHFIRYRHVSIFVALIIIRAAYKITKNPKIGLNASVNHSMLQRMPQTFCSHLMSAYLLLKSDKI